MRTRFVLLVVGAILFVCVGVGVALSKADASGYPEAASIGKGVKDFDELSKRFTDLADEKGALYAFGVLARADLPPNTDLHLLGHAVGDELYKQKGVAGIADCTPDFRNACSHAIVVGALNEYGGTKALALIQDACSKAPGGSGAYTMCYHGLGHGVFAYFGYDLGKTVDFCRKTGTEEYNEREYQECVGGSIMELMGGGGHDHDLWLAAQAKYYDPNDPLAPCDTSVIPDDVRGNCYVYITPHLFAAAGADLNIPGPSDFSKAFTYCDRISKTTPRFREGCFGGIGKEFPVLAMLRDIRNVADATDEQLQQMYAWCSLAPHAEAFSDCEHAVISSLYWGGENEPRAAIGFCSVADIDQRSECFSALFAEASHYVSPGDPTITKLCAQVPKEYAAACKTTFSL